MKAISLLSSGIDSPVASKLMAKKGFEIIYLHLKLTPDADAVKNLKSKIDKNAQLIIKEFYSELEKISLSANKKYTCILCKRSMLRIAQEVAKEHGAEAIITGENLGQVASQTLENMKVIDEAVKIPVIRPLLCLDKMEIVKLAREIGTYRLSTIENKKCPFVPPSPATKSKLEKVQKEENMFFTRKHNLA